MPSKSIPDGPVCSDPEAIAKGWLQTDLVAGRGRHLERLMQRKAGDKDDRMNTQVILPTKANMVHNAPILEVLAKDMSQRTRVGADPIDVVCQMTLAYYQSIPPYSTALPGFNVKAVAYNDAWSIHKMISNFRNPVTKYETTRDIWLTLSSFFLHKVSFILCVTVCCTVFTTHILGICPQQVLPIRYLRNRSCSKPSSTSRKLTHDR